LLKHKSCYFIHPIPGATQLEIRNSYFLNTSDELVIATISLSIKVSTKPEDPSHCQGTFLADHQIHPERTPSILHTHAHKYIHTHTLSTLEPNIALQESTHRSLLIYYNTITSE
jgi:hypothetical protein